MIKQITVVVIATRSLPLADGLDALLKVIPEIERVEIVRTLENALQRVEDIKPRILLLDLALAGKQPEAFLRKISVLSPETLRVLLVDDVLDMQWRPQFAEAVLIKGALPSTVATTLNDLLKGKEHEQAQGAE
jgi:DNA-binding NarL/FixJ family response regulator